MPFTPFHLGPGAAFKLVGGRRFSFFVFGLSQVLIDVEVLLRMRAGSPILHGFSNTVLGATLIGLLSTLAGKPLGEACRKIWNGVLPSPSLAIATPLSWPIAALSAFVGTYSHVLLDAVMHGDAEPWAPVAPGNPFLEWVPVAELHSLCVGAGIMGAAGLLIRWIYLVAYAGPRSGRRL